MSAGYHPDVQTHLKVGPKNVEKLVRHVFKAPQHRNLVEKYFPTAKFMRDELPPPKPRNLILYPPF